MKEPGLDNRHRDKNGEISRKHGNTLVGTLRKQYGAAFAPGFKDTDKLSNTSASQRMIAAIASLKFWSQC